MQYRRKQQADLGCGCGAAWDGSRGAAKEIGLGKYPWEKLPPKHPPVTFRSPQEVVVGLDLVWIGGQQQLLPSRLLQQRQVGGV